VLGTGDLLCQAVSPNYGTGEKALWENLIVALALSVFPMCLEVKGW